MAHTVTRNKNHTANPLQRTQLFVTAQKEA
jgi:hypothetical protein